MLIKRGNNSNHISGINACDSAGRTKIEIAGRESLLRLYRFLRRQPGLEPSWSSGWTAPNAACAKPAPSSARIP